MINVNITMYYVDRLQAVKQKKACENSAHARYEREKDVWMSWRCCLSGENPDPERLLCNRDLSKIKFTDFKKKKKKKKNLYHSMGKFSQ